MDFITLSIRLMRFIKLPTMNVMLAVVVMLFSATHHVSANPLDGKNILVLHSYHQTYMFTDQEMNGILRVLRKNNHGYMPYVEYLDWKRFPDENRISRIKETLNNKYSGIIFDVVIATDNKALEFALKYRSQLFSKAAISFCGINGYKDTMIQGQDRISGVVEDVDPVGTVNLIMAMLPDTHEIVVLVDDSESSNEVLEEIGKALVERKKLSMRVLRSPDQNELISAVSGLKAGSVLLQGNFSRDRTGRTFEFEEVLAHILQHTKVPIFSLWDFLEGKGITGGSLLSGEIQGENAARIALQFINGERSVPVMTKSPTKVLLDYRQLKHFNLESRPIPSGVKVINQPVSFVKIYFKTIVAVILTISVLLAIIAALVVAIRKKDQAEKSLSESEERYRTIFDSSTNAVFIHDLDTGAILDVNEKMCEMYGYSREEVLHGDVGILGTGEPSYALQNALEWISKAAQGEPQFFEWEAKHKDGYMFWVDVKMRRVKIGSMNRLLVSASDISLRKQQEKALRESEERLSQIIDFLPDATFAIDLSGNVIAWNRAIEEMTGVKTEEMLGKGDYEYSLPFYGVRRPILIDLVFMLDEEIKNKYSFIRKVNDCLIAEAEVPVKRGGNRILWGIARPLYDSTGHMLGAIESIRDITDRKQAEDALRRSEANYRMVVENIQDVLYRSDAQGNLIMASPSLLSLLRYESLNECLGKPIAETFYFNPEKRKEFSKIIREKGKVTNFELVLKRSDGTPVIVEVSSNKYLNDSGNFAGVGGIFRDISERKQAEIERKKLENQLIQAQKMEAIGTLAGGIAHDFNNILSGIMGYTELSLYAIKDQPKLHQNMEQVLVAAKRAKDLVKQILTFCRKAQQETSPTSLSLIIKEVVKFMRASLPTNIEIQQHIDLVHDIVMADPSQLHQVLVNLCTNAGYAMKENGGILEIGLKEVSISKQDLLQNALISKGQCLELSVRDSGQGISQENLSKIFEPYFTTKGQEKGTGLGLAVVHGIVKSHGGEIRVYSELGKGTIFRIFLPLLTQQAKQEEKSDETIERGNGEMILLVDDENMLVDLDKSMLDILGYRVISETDPVKAIETFKKNFSKIDLVITDKTMPRMNGFEFAQKIREIRADIPIILNSGFQDEDDMQKVQTVGINQFLQKPFDLATFADAVHNALKR